MMSRRFHHFASRLVVAVTAAHPYRDAVLGDLEERRASVETALGADSARRWYDVEAVRSTAAMTSTLPIEPASAARISVLVIAMYVAVIQTSSRSAAWLEAQLKSSGGMVFGSAYLTIICVTGALGGFVVTKSARRNAFSAAVLMIGLTAALGTAHVIGAGRGELSFRLAKVLLFTVAVVSGCTTGVVSAVDRSNSQRCASSGA